LARGSELVMAWVEGRHRQTHADAHGEHAGQDGRVAAVDGHEQRHQHQAEGGQGDADSHGGAGADPGGHLRGQAGGRHHHDGHRHHRRRGQQPRPAERCLEEREEDDGDTGLDAEDDEQGDRAGGQAAFPEEAYVQQERVAAVQFPGHEGDGGGDADGQADQGDGGGPAAFGAFLQGEDETDHGDGGDQRADGVEGTGGAFAGVGHRLQSHRQRDGDQDHGQHEQPAPVGGADQQSGEEHAQDAAASGNTGPHADRPASLLLGEGGGDDREGGGKSAQTCRALSSYVALVLGHLFATLSPLCIQGISCCL
jgi:hypothetical protein